MTRPQDVVTGTYQKVRAGAMEEARALWSDGAVWHLTGTSALAGDYTADDYLSFLRQFLQDYPDYRAEWLDIRTYDDTLLVANLRLLKGLLES
jgi:ketosteroid isomerase-like protein